MTASAAKRVTTASSTSRWEELFGCPVPRRLPSLVDQAIAWREQVLLHGDVPPAIAHDLQLAAEHASMRRGVAAGDKSVAPVLDTPGQASQSITAEEMAAAADVCSVTATPIADVASSPRRAGATRRQAVLPPAASQLLPGSQLIKAHGGRNHVVAVEADGFRYEGELFSSLSAIAKHITGTHWNGLLFFGLRKRRSYPPKPRRHG